MRTAAQVVARFRRWYRCPHLFQQAGNEIAQPLVPTPRENEKSSHIFQEKKNASVGVGHRTAEICKRLTLNGRLASGGRRVIEQLGQSASFFVAPVRDGLLYHSQLTTTSVAIHSEVAIQSSHEVAHTTSVEPKRHDPSDFQIIRCKQRDHRKMHMVERSLWAYGYEMSSQLRQHPGASVRKKWSWSQVRANEILGKRCVRT